MTMLMPISWLKLMGSSSIVTSLLVILAERRELNILPAMDEELNCLADAKWFNFFVIPIWLTSSWPLSLRFGSQAAQRADYPTLFERSVQRFIQFHALIRLEIPDIDHFIHNSREIAMTVGSLKFESYYTVRLFMQKALNSSV